MLLPPDLWSLIASIAHVRWPPQTASEADLLIRQSATESLLPLLFETAPPEGPLEKALYPWRAFLAAVRHRAAIVERTVAGLPERIGEDIILLKGSDVAFRLYAAPHLRPMTDIDVLIRKEAIERVIASMAAHGFRPHYTRFAHLSPRNPDLAFDLGEITLEIHHSLVHRSSAAIDYVALWNDRVPGQTAGVNTFRLDDRDALITSALSIAKDGFTGPLIRYLDVWLALKARPDLIETTLERAAKWRVANALRAVLVATNRFFPDLDIHLRRRPWFDHLVRVPAAHEGRHVKRVSTRVRLWRKYWTLDGMDLRFRYFADISIAAMAGFFHRDRLRSAKPSGAVGRI